MATSAKLGMMGIIFGVLLLIVGLVLSDIIIRNVNRQGARIDCFDGNDLLIKNAFGPMEVAGSTGTETEGAGVTTKTKTTASTRAVPNKVGSAYPGADVIGDTCGTAVEFVQTDENGARNAQAYAKVPFGTSPTCSSGGTCGTIRYTLEVFGADSLNNLFTLIYWIVLVGISLASIGAGGYGVAHGYRGAM